MKVIGKSGNDIIVTMNKQEFAAITGERMYDKLVTAIFDNGHTPAVEVLSTIANILTVSKVPGELFRLLKTLDEVTKIVTEAQLAAANVDCIKNGRQPKKETA